MHMMHMICMVRLEGSIQTDLVPREEASRIRHRSAVPGPSVAKRRPN